MDCQTGRMVDMRSEEKYQAVALETTVETHASDTRLPEQNWDGYNHTGTADTRNMEVEDTA